MHYCQPLSIAINIKVVNNYLQILSNNLIVIFVIDKKVKFLHESENLKTWIL